MMKIKLGDKKKILKNQQKHVLSSFHERGVETRIERGIRCSITHGDSGFSPFVLSSLIDEKTSFLNDFVF